MRLTVAFAALAALVIAGAASAGGTASHSHDAGAAAEAVSVPSARFATDRPLHEGMESIRAALVARAGAIHAGSLAPRQYRALAASIERDMASIVANCKLEPAADAQLHAILGQIGAGTAAMQGQGEESPAEGAVRIGTALNAYAERFDDPAFAPVAMHAHVGARVAQAGR